MQGVIAVCLEQMVQEEFGKDKWEEIVERAGLARDTTFVGQREVADDTVVIVVKSTCDVLGLSAVEVADTFKEYWVRVFAPRLYSVYYSSANEMLRAGAHPLAGGDDRSIIIH